MAAFNDVYNTANPNPGAAGVGNTSDVIASASGQTPTLQTRDGYEVYEGTEPFTGYANSGVPAHDVSKYSKKEN